LEADGAAVVYAVDHEPHMRLRLRRAGRLALRVATAEDLLARGVQLARRSARAARHGCGLRRVLASATPRRRTPTPSRDTSRSAAGDAREPAHLHERRTHARRALADLRLRRLQLSVARAPVLHLGSSDRRGAQ